MEGVVGVAAHYGCTAYAQQLSRKAWKVRHSRSHR
jgi:hypothetical protein